MMSDNELRDVLVKISDLESAGLLNEAKDEIADRLRGRPTEPMQTLTGNQYLSAHWLADTASRLLDIPRDGVLRVAVDLFIPSRQQVVGEVVGQYAAQLARETRPREWQPEPTPQPSRPVVVNVRKRKAAPHGK
ncbi:MAG: hypothetical protein LLG00_10415 [Planctomycetaceae bacterium]|nr:hypothetical protein [Planctomycetaceae bacterium]